MSPTPGNVHGLLGWQGSSVFLDLGQALTSFPKVLDHCKNQINATEVKGRIHLSLAVIQHTFGDLCPVLQPDAPPSAAERRRMAYA